MASSKDDSKFSKMCRLCMDQNVLLVHLQSNKGNAKHAPSNILDVIEDFTTVKIAQSDNLPKKICESCLRMINSMVAFRNKCKLSDEEFRKAIESPACVDETVQIKIEILDYSYKEILDDSYKEILDNSYKKENLNAYESEFLLEPDEESQQQLARLAAEVNSVSYAEETAVKRSRIAKVACHICGKLYDLYRLKFHINKHNGLKPYECKEPDCTSKFSDPHDLNKHKKLCHILKPELCCDVCGRGFKVKVGLEMHRSYHFDPKLPCKICEKLFRNTRALNKHMLVHSQERKFKCETCGKSYQTRYTLRIHKRVHTQEKPYPCHCGVSFAYKCLLKAHNEKYHK